MLVTSPFLSATDVFGATTSLTGATMGFLSNFSCKFDKSFDIESQSSESSV